MISKHRIALAIVLLGLVTVSIKATFYHSGYNWEVTPDYQVPDTGIYAKQSAIILKDVNIFEYKIEQNSYNPPAFYITSHRIVAVNDDKAIEEYSKVYIPMRDFADLYKIKIRTTLPDGNVIVQSKESLRELEDVEGYGRYKIFAIEGLERGAITEYVYTLKQNVRTYGRKITQLNAPVVESIVKVISNKKIDIKAKSYNGYSKPETSYDGKYQIITASQKNIDVLPEEEYSAHSANLMRVDYKLTMAYGRAYFNSWQKIAEGINNDIKGAKGASSVKKILKKIISDTLNNEEKILVVEDYLKTNITLKREFNPEYTNIKSIIKNKVANRMGLASVMSACYTYLGISHDIVLASDRLDYKFDPDFASYLNLTDVLFYFPLTKQYVAPANLVYRLGPAPFQNGGSKGLKAIKNDYVSYFKIHDIDILDYEKNQMGVDVYVKVNPEFEALQVDKTHFSQGYNSFMDRYYINYSNKEELNEFVNEYVLSGLEEISSLTYDCRNTETLKSYTNDTLYINTKFNSSSIIENAGNDYLLSLGSLIGKQSELYQEKERVQPIETNFPRTYRHRIEFEIPEGYTVDGADAFKISKQLLDSENNPKASFISDYVLNGKTIIITVEEFYTDILYPIEDFNNYKAVINAAADFSKTTLLLKKE